MACPAIITGDDFLLRTLTHIDCQAQLIASYGYQALGQPGSTASIFITSLLTIFIALFGIRLLLGPGPQARDVVLDVLKVGIVLTIAFSWPTFRTVIYDTVLKGPAEVASAIQTGSGNAQGEGVVARLQMVDNAIVELTTVGTGRNLSALVEGDQAGGTFEASAIDDDDGFGAARLLYLAGTMGTVSILRIGAGILLALAPLVAGLYFFPQTRGIFAGWLKGLTFLFAGSVGTAIVLSVQLAILEPWLFDALKIRSLGYAAPAAPIELFAINLSFVIVQLGMLWLLAKIVFYKGWLTLPDFPQLSQALTGRGSKQEPEPQILEMNTPRATHISTSIENAIRRERLIDGGRSDMNRTGNTADDFSDRPPPPESPRLGSSYRRSSIRMSRSAQLRDQER